jgi:hypothetical protein
MSYPVIGCAVEHHGLERFDLLVAVGLAHHAHEDGSGVWCAQATLARELGISRSTVQRALDRLVAKGHADREVHGGKNGTNRYRFKLCPSCLSRMQEGDGGLPLPASPRRTKRTATRRAPLPASQRRGGRLSERREPSPEPDPTTGGRSGSGEGVARAAPPAQRAALGPGHDNRAGGAAPEPPAPPTERSGAGEPQPVGGDLFAAAGLPRPAEVAAADAAGLAEARADCERRRRARLAAAEAAAASVPPAGPEPEPEAPAAPALVAHGGQGHSGGPGRLPLATLLLGGAQDQAGVEAARGAGDDAVDAVAVAR